VTVLELSCLVLFGADTGAGAGEMCVRGFLWRGPVGGCACPDLDTAAEFDDPCGEACRMDFAGYGGVAIGSSILEVERLVFRASISVVFSISSLLGVSIIAHQRGK